MRCISVFHEDGHNFAGFSYECLESSINRRNKAWILTSLEIDILLDCENQWSDSCALGRWFVARQTNKNDREKLVDGLELLTHDFANLNEYFLGDCSDFEVGVGHRCNQLYNVVFQESPNLIKSACYTWFQELRQLIDVSLDQSQSWLGCLTFN